MKQFTLSIIIVMITICLMSSCGNQTQRSLEKVAKDWSMTIRAGQIMPIYPIEEDIRPGDVYLVNNTIDAEIKTWNEKGFLPLINRYDRIPISPITYDYIYQNAFDASDPVAYYRAPKVAFPTYSFAIDNRGVFGLALPLRSVPVALSLSGARSGTGTVTFSKATTQGLPDHTMEKILFAWADSNQQDLAGRAQQTDNTLLLRVVTRVFFANAADVSISFAQTYGGELQAGKPPTVAELWGASKEDYEELIKFLDKEIELLKTTGSEPTVEIPEDTDEKLSREDQIKALEARLDSLKRLKANAQMDALERHILGISMIDQYGGYVMPGTAVKVVGRSDRTITLKEGFDKPLVIGYWASEYFVTQTGSLVFVGQVRDLVDNEQAYRDLLERAKQQAEKPNKQAQVGFAGVNPF